MTIVETASPVAHSEAVGPKPRKSGRVRTARVKHKVRLTPEMIRIVFDGPDLEGLPVGDFCDAYVKLVFPPLGAPYRTADEFARMRDTLDAAHRPTLRTYTVRAYDADTAELTLDFVYHGDSGLAGPWAARAQAGDEIFLLGPGGDYCPDAQASWHLLIGDESALPAISVVLERLPAGRTAYVFLEVADAREQQPLTPLANVSVTWVHRDDHQGVHGAGLVAAVAAADLPAETPDVFLHGEAGFVKQLRHHLRFERSVPREALSVSGYWRRGRDDEAWRAEKAAWKTELEADEQHFASRSS